ncbi:MAG: site-2 protease family protein [Candidatus Micrarchaeia archaeon]
MREHILFGKEIEELLLADLVLTFAFSLVIVGGIGDISQLLNVFIYFIPISFVAVSLSFILHELMHKFVAQKYGAIAAFKTSQYGLAITLITSLFGFLIGIPGATIIYTNNFTKREDGHVSIAGPLTNFLIFLVFFAAGMLLYKNFIANVTTTLSISMYMHNSYLHNMINLTLFISILLAFFNMLPIYPLDGSKVLRWNKGIYAAMLITIFALFALVIPLVSLIIGLAFMLVFAYIFSMLYRNVLF